MLSYLVIFLRQNGIIKYTNTATKTCHKCLSQSATNEVKLGIMCNLFLIMQQLTDNSLKLSVPSAGCSLSRAGFMQVCSTNVIPG